ncbi:MAG: sulfite exporter TauE/SafE family protein [Deltaproteobacteria bacterium]|nr:sulfite exporter TauE/SafE family protein [Deltaproteobacteria bacterium]
MSGGLLLTLFTLAGVAGFGAGFIGLGGGILLFPLLLYLPPVLSLEAIDAKTVAALVISQVFFAGVVGGAAHWRQGRVHKKLTLVGALASAVGAFIGGIGSKWVSEWFLLLLFGIVTVFAGAIMFLPGPSLEKEQLPVEQVSIPAARLAPLSLVVGLVVGVLGAGNFLFVPLLIYVLKIPTRVTIGSALAIHVLNGFAGFMGKLITGQVPFLMTVAVLIGAGVGAIAGEKCHSRVSPKVLRYAYAGVIAIVAVRIWSTLLGL